MYRDIVGAGERAGRPVAAAARRRSRPSSAPGTATGRAPIANGRASPLTSARPSSCRPWSSAIAGPHSATGVLFTRDPATGENVLYGDVLFGAQGEDVVAGTHATEPISVLDERLPGRGGASCARTRTAWSGTSGTSATSSSPSRKGGSGCSRTASASAPRRRPAASPWRWPRTRLPALAGRGRRARRGTSWPTRHGRPPERPAMPSVIAVGLGASPGLASGAIATSAEAAVRMADAGGGRAARARRDVARRRPRHGPRGRHPDLHGRPRQPRRGGGAGLGHPGRRGRRRRRRERRAR